MALGNRPKGERLPYTATLWYVSYHSSKLSNIEYQTLLKGVRNLGCVPASLLFLVDSEVICGMCDFPYNMCLLTYPFVKDIPRQLKSKTSSEVVAAFFEPPIGALIAAMISTFGTYLSWHRRFYTNIVP